MTRALRRIGAGLLIAILAFGLGSAWRLRWVCDDAFISFRYARNWAEGLGVVFNAGAAVEGYTNFLWTALAAGAIALGGDPVRLSQLAGIACFAATLALLVAGGARLRGPAAAWLGIAAAGLALNTHGQIFATGGLETSLFTLLVTANLVALAGAQHPRSYAFVGLLGALALLTRPDAAVFVAIAGFDALRRSLRERRALTVVAFALPLLLIYLPYFIWRWNYYGLLLPNTFYAKSAGSPYPSQGLFYLWLYLRCYWVLGVGLVALAIAVLIDRREHGPSKRAGRLVLSFVAAYAGFVTWVGGDFMFARFVAPIVPAAYLGIELLAARWQRPAAIAGLAAFAIGGTLLRAYPDEITQPRGARGIVEERHIYTPEKLATTKRLGEHLREQLRGSDASVAIVGGQAALAYFGEFAEVIDCSTGLTDAYLAQLELPERGRIGHEKGIALDPDYLYRRGIQLALAPVVRDSLDDFRWIELGRFDPDGTGRRSVPATMSLVTWDRALLDTLRRRPGVVTPDFESYLDRYIASLDARSRAEVERDYAAFRRFYFDVNEDSARQRAFEERLAGES